MAEVSNSADERIVSNGNNIRKTKRIVVPLVILLLLAGLVGGYWYVYLRGNISTDDAYIDGDQITVSSKILGRVAQLAVDEGDTVKQGQVLVVLDDADLKAQLAQAQASLEYVQQNVPVARINLDKARDDFNRASLLFKGSVIPQEQLDHSRRAMEMAEAQYKVAVSQVASTQAQVGVIETQLANTRITAPSLGVVARKWVVPGGIVQAGQPIYTLYDPSDVWVTANFEETKLTHIAVGEPVAISVDAYPDHEFTGKVELIGAAAASQFSLIPPSNASGNFTKVTQRVPVKISVDATDPDGAHKQYALLPGMSVEVKLRARQS